MLVHRLVNRLVRIINTVLLVFGRDAAGERRVWLHWQNLNEETRGHIDTVKGWPYHGRATLNFPRRIAIGWSWNLWTHFAMAQVRVDGTRGGDRDIIFSLGLPPVAFWLTLEGVVPRRVSDWWVARYRYEARTTGLRVFDAAIWWDVWCDPDSLSRETPRWRNGSWHPIDTIFGRFVVTNETLSKHVVKIPMPEGAYDATVELVLDRWKRPRLPWSSGRQFRANVDVPEGIPHQGKGENSWDCDEQRTTGFSMGARTVAEAIGRVVESALASRARYDGDAMSAYPPPSGPKPAARAEVDAPPAAVA